MIKPFHIALFSSSDFIIPIIETITSFQGKTLLEVLNTELNNAIIPQHIRNYISYLDASFTENLNRPVQLSFIVSQPDRLNRNKIVANPVAQHARINNITLFTPEKINKEYHLFEENLVNLDIIIVASFGQIISQTILNFPRFGVINWHPSLLPLYRGATPLQTTLANGDTQTALTWMEMDKGMDSGDILMQLPYVIPQTETTYTLAKNMANYGLNTWATAITLQVLHRTSKLENKTIVAAQHQDHNLATFCIQLTKEDAFVNPLNQSAQVIFNHWRAYLAFPGTKIVSSTFSKEIKIRSCAAFIQHSKIANSESEIVFENEQWLQVRASDELNVDAKKTQKTYLKCSNNSLLEVLEIGLSNGKVINFSGYQFSTSPTYLQQ